MGQAVTKSDPIDVVGKPDRVLILEMDWELEAGSKRHAHRIVGVHYLKAEDIRDEHV